MKKKHLFPAFLAMFLLAATLLSVTAFAEAAGKQEKPATDTGIELDLHQSLLDGRSGSNLHVYPGDEILYVVTARNVSDTTFANAVMQFPLSVMEKWRAVPMGDYGFTGNYVVIGDIGPGETVARGFLLTVPENGGSTSYGTCVSLASLKTAGKFDTQDDVESRVVSNSVRIQIGDPDLNVYVHDKHVRIVNGSSKGGADKIVLEFPLDAGFDTSELPDGFSVRGQKLVLEAGGLVPYGTCEFDLPYAAVPDRVTYATGDVLDIRLPAEAIHAE